MTDVRAREIERVVIDPASEALVLVQRVRRGELTPSRMKLAAFAGHGAALLAFACRDDDIRDGDRGCVCWYGRDWDKGGPAGAQWIECLVNVFGEGGTSTLGSIGERVADGTLLGAFACLHVCYAVWNERHANEASAVAHAINALQAYVENPCDLTRSAYEVAAGNCGARQRWITSPAHALVGPLGWSYFEDAVDNAADLIGYQAVRVAMNNAVARWALEVK